MQIVVFKCSDRDTEEKNYNQMCDKERTPLKKRSSILVLGDNLPLLCRKWFSTTPTELNENQSCWLMCYLSQKVDTTLQFAFIQEYLSRNSQKCLQNSLCREISVEDMWAHFPQCPLTYLKPKITMLYIMPRLISAKIP